MTPQEFKAWFEGYAENIAGVPTPEQWARVKAKVAEVGQNSISIPTVGTPSSGGVVIPSDLRWMVSNTCTLDNAGYA